jgi:hypothetical protein
VDDGVLVGNYEKKGLIYELRFATEERRVKKTGVLSSSVEH